MKRQHQIEFEKIIDTIIADRNSIRKILCKVTPGGGKSALPIITGKLITAGLVDKLIWICPRMTLQVQGERNFIDPFFRSMFTHNLSIRSSTNELDPCRGLNGFTTTYQAIAADAGKTVLPDLHKYRYAVILDEFHHADLEGEWYKALMPIVEASHFLVLMTGTLERGDNKKIGFVEYSESRYKYGEFPMLVGDDKTAVITYERGQALQDHAILPIHFVFSDGRSAWENVDGSRVSAESFYNVLPKERGAALYSALATEFAEHLLALTLNHFMSHFKSVPSAKMLVVTANIGEARRHYKSLVKNGYAAGLATSHDTQEAVDRIEDFRSGNIDILVTIAMAYEGLDIPAISHIACLTHIRSKPWIEQMFGRGVRIDPAAGAWNDQIAYVFAPDDILMREIVQEIELEQLRSASSRPEFKKIILTSSDKSKMPKITPLESAATKQREARLNSLPKTPKQREELLLAEIEGHIRRYAFNNRLEPRQINTELFRHFGKPRRSMRYSELENLLAYIKQAYPSGRPVRGTGVKRLPTDVEFLESDAFDDSFMAGFKYT